MNSKLRKALVFSLLILLAGCGGGGGGTSGNNLPPFPAPQPSPNAGVIGDGRLDDLVEWARQSQGVPAMAIVLVANGQIAEMSSVGRRTLSAPDVVSADDQWHLGSLTKGMTATLAGVLIEQSIISWDTKPLDIWPELDATINPAFRDVTLKRLLSHTSGMRRADVTPIEYDHNAPGTAIERRRAYSAKLLSEPPIGPTGQDSYSNGGFIVAGAMMETIMSTPWEVLLTEQVFNPLGMLDSGFGAPGLPGSVDQPWGHLDTGPGYDPVAPGPDADVPDTMGPAGTVHATLADYGQFMLSHIAGARGVDGLLTVPTYEVIQTPVANGSAPGWGVLPFEDWAQGPVLTFAGSNQRWFAVVRLAPELNAGAMVVVNAGGGRAEAAIDSLSDLILERFQASQ